MKRPLLDVIFASEKRMSVLLLLQEDPQEMDNLLKSLETTRTALLPQIKLLEEHYLVAHYDDIYELTTIGKLAVDKMKPLLDIIDVFETDIDYWGTHNIDFIPKHLMKRIDELGQCRLIKPDITDIYEINKEFHEATKRSKSHYVVTTFLHPNFQELAADLVNNGVELYFILSRVLFNKLLERMYEDLLPILQNRSVHLFIYSGEMDFQFVSVNDHYIMMALLQEDRKADVTYLLCNGGKSQRWGKDFFDHFLKNSTPMTEI